MLTRFLVTSGVALLWIVVAGLGGAPAGRAASAVSPIEPPPAPATTGAAGATGATGSEAPEPPHPLVAKQQILLTEYDALFREVEGARERLAAVSGEERLVLEEQIERKKLEFLEVVRQIIDNLLAQESQQLDVGEIRSDIASVLVDITSALERHIIDAERRAERSRLAREARAPEALVDLERRIASEMAWIEELLGASRTHLSNLDKMGLESEPARVALIAHLEDRAADIAGRVSFVSRRLLEVQERLTQKVGDVDLEARKAALDIRRQTLTHSLTSVLDLMDQFDLETARHRQLLITSTGEITAHIFDTELAMGLLREWWDETLDWLREKAPGFAFKLLLFVLILTFFKLLSVLLRRILRKAFASAHVKASQLLQNMAVSVVSNSFMMLGILVGLSQLGVQLGPLLAGLGIAGFIVGFALQETLGNFASGMMILAYRPYDEGDLIEAAGVFGRVDHMSLVSTTILTIDNQTLIVPNGKIWGDVIKNVTNQPTRRVDLKFSVAYGSDVDRVRELFEDLLAEHDKVLDDPEPTVQLHELGEWSLIFVVRPWVYTGDYWDVYWDLTRAAKQRLDAAGIEIPFPQRDVHVKPPRDD